MARYLVNNAKFTPFSFEEYVRPYQMMTEEYTAREEALAALEADAEAYKHVLNPEEEAYKIYSNYVNDLKNYSDILSNVGLSGLSRKELYKMKSRYNSEIGGIKKAAEEYDAMRAYREKLREKNPRIQFDVEYNNISDFLNGKKAVNTYIDPDNITNITATLAADWASKQTPTIVDRMFVDDEETEVMTTVSQGASLDDISKVIKGSVNGYNYEHGLSDVAKAMLQQLDYDNRSPEVKKAILAAINKGMFMGQGKTTSDITPNRAYDTPYNKALADYYKNNAEISELELEARKEREDIKSGKLPFRKRTEERPVTENGNTVSKKFLIKEYYNEDTRTIWSEEGLANSKGTDFEEGASITSSKSKQYYLNRPSDKVPDSYVVFNKGDGTAEETNIFDESVLRKATEKEIEANEALLLSIPGTLYFTSDGKKVIKRDPVTTIDEDDPNAPSGLV